MEVGSPIVLLICPLTGPEWFLIASLIPGIRCLKLILYDSYSSLGLVVFSKELLELGFEPRQYNNSTHALDCVPEHLILP